MSHRGTKQYSALSLALAKKCNALTAISTSLESKVEADYVFRTSIGETSSAFTVSHMCAITVLAMLAKELGKQFGVPAAQNLVLDSLPDLLQQTLTSAEPVIRNWIAQNGAFCDRFWFVGTGANSVNGLEAALKLKETCYVNCEGFQLEQFLHGPFCGLSENTLVVFMAPSKPSPRYDRTITLLKATQKAQAKTVLITHASDDFQDGIASKWIIPDTITETQGTFCHLLMVQLFTYWLTVDLQLGHPDTFRLHQTNFEQARQVYSL